MWGRGEPPPFPFESLPSLLGTLSGILSRGPEWGTLRGLVLNARMLDLKMKCVSCSQFSSAWLRLNPNREERRGLPRPWPLPVTAPCLLLRLASRPLWGFHAFAGLCPTPSASPGHGGPSASHPGPRCTNRGSCLQVPVENSSKNTPLPTSCCHRGAKRGVWPTALFPGDPFRGKSKREEDWRERLPTFPIYYIFSFKYSNMFKHT